MRGSPGRHLKSVRSIDGTNRLLPPVNRAVARELYISKTVNVVGANKVKPGQMNLFNSKNRQTYD